MAFMAAFFFITGGAAFMAFIAAFFFITFMAFMAAFFFITFMAFIAAFFFITFMAFMAAFFFITFMAFMAAFLGLFTGTAVTAGSLAALRADRRVKRLEVEPTKLVLYFDEILEGETIELEAETVSPVANLQPTSSIVYEYYQPENQALAISRSDDSSGTFVREKAVDAEEAIGGRQIIDSAAGAHAPKLFSAAAGAGIALMALV